MGSEYRSTFCRGSASSHLGAAMTTTASHAPPAAPAARPHMVARPYAAHGLLLSVVMLRPPHLGRWPRGAHLAQK